MYETRCERVSIINMTYPMTGIRPI